MCVCALSIQHIIAALAPKMNPSSTVEKEEEERRGGLEDTWLSWDELVIADQLCLLHHSLFSRLRSAEVMNWLKSKKKVRDWRIEWTLIFVFFF